MSIRKRLQFLECQAKPVTATEPGTSEAARALAFIAKWKARIDADPEAWAAGAEARAAARRMAAMLGEMPLRNLVVFSGGRFSPRGLQFCIHLMNRRYLTALKTLIGRGNC